MGGVTVQTLADRLRTLRGQIARAAQDSGRDPADITLVAAAKTMPPEAIRLAVAAGVDAVGENRVQELCEKDACGAYEGVPLHFIGHLQKNKVARVVGRADLIHSVDSAALAEAIETRAAGLNLVQSVLLQVNIAGESTKGGFSPAEIFEALKTLSALRHIAIEGLMCIPPPVGLGGDIQYFVDMHQLYIDIRQKNMDNISMKILSMGMSDDFEQAIRAGATMVRIGSALFGPRAPAGQG